MESEKGERPMITETTQKWATTICKACGKKVEGCYEPNAIVYCSYECYCWD